LVGMICRETSRDDPQARRRGVQADVRSQLRLHVVAAVAARLRRIEGQRHPQIASPENERLGHDAGDEVRAIRHAQRPADGAGIGAESRLPELEADDDDRGDGDGGLGYPSSATRGHDGGRVFGRGGGGGGGGAGAIRVISAQDLAASSNVSPPPIRLVLATPP